MMVVSDVLNTVQNTDALRFLKTLPDECVHSIITSPPYYAQRDYGAPEQIGLEETPEQYIERLVEIFCEARRVLRKDGTFWLNIGDTYVGATSQHKEGGSQGKNSRYSRKHMNGIPTTGRAKRNKTFYEMGLPMKSLVGMPWRVAFALQQNGWILRCDIIWHRPSASESVKDRPTHAHEYVFMFAKSQHYYYDRSAMLTQTGANIHSVWKIGGSPFTGAHCAVFPPELIDSIVRASCPPNGIIFDPFGGTGTVGLVSHQYGRNFILCEINAENARMARERVTTGITRNDKTRLKGHQYVQTRMLEPVEAGSENSSRALELMALAAPVSTIETKLTQTHLPKTSHRGSRSILKSKRQRVRHTA
jgi:site-specific DNA-methyltransferase (adenine-specific)